MLENTSDSTSLAALKDILLREERAKMEQVQAILNEQDKLSQKVSPIIEEHLELLKKHFPKEFEVAVHKIVEQKLQSSQQELLDVLYPTMGKMIQKYIAYQIQLIKDGVDEKINYAFSSKGLIWKIRTSIFGVQSSDAIISGIKNFSIDEIYVIQKDSGLLMGIATKAKIIDQDVVAGMMTAIKAFVEDAFKQEKEDLELIEYGTYKIMLQSFYSYYVAVAVKGALSRVEREEIRGRLYDFATVYLHNMPVYPDQITFDMISEALSNDFFDEDNERKGLTN